MRKLPLNLLVFSRLCAYCRLMRWHRPKPILLLLWPTLWALWIAAQGMPDTKILVIFISGVFIMRSAGCVINDIIDQRFDQVVVRTANRPLAKAELNSVEARIIFVILSFIGLLLVLQLNRLSFYLSIIALLLAIIYPFCKRYHYFPQLILGITWYMSIPMAFAAQINQIPAVAWLVYVIAVVWAIIYDTFYACADREDDKRLGLKSTAILFAKYERIIIAIFQLLMLCLLLLLGQYLNLSVYYKSSLVVIVVLFIYQQILISKKRPDTYLKAFIDNHWIGLCLFIGLFLSF